MQDSFISSVIFALQQNDWLFFTTVILLGLVVGSFLNVVIYRLPIMLEKEWTADCTEFLKLKKQDQEEAAAAFTLATPASTCPECGHKIRFWENIPVLSYIILGGKCSNCKTPISVQYPIIELLTAILSVLIAYKFGVSWMTLLGMIFAWSLIALTVIDLHKQLLPDNITLPLLWLGILANSFEVYTDLESAVFGAIAGYLVLWIVYQTFKLLTGKEGMGFGDFKLLAALGAWMGWQMLPQIILLSSLVGAIIGIAMMIIVRHDRNIPIPFGPYLAIAGMIAFIWGDYINRAWLQIFQA